MGYINTVPNGGKPLSYTETTRRLATLNTLITRESGGSRWDKATNSFIPADKAKRAALILERETLYATLAA